MRLELIIRAQCAGKKKKILLTNNRGIIIALVYPRDFMSSGMYSGDDISRLRGVRRNRACINTVLIKSRTREAAAMTLLRALTVAL